VIQFFVEYGLFLLKLVTFLILAGLFISSMIGIASGNRQKSNETLCLEKINDNFDDYEKILESELLTKNEQKKRAKERKKQDKQKAKQQTDTEQKRLFVVRFDGDIHASEIEHLRESITAILTTARKDIDEVLVIIESPGGAVHSYGLAASQLQRIRARGVKLIAAVDLVAASGGYMMACVANEIIAAPFAVVGSIGVIGQVPNFNKLLSKNHIDIEQHTSGKFKTTLTMLGKNTQEARDKFIDELEDTHELFKQFVHNFRPKIDLAEIATGEHWYGQQAVSMNLVDKVTTSDDYLMAKRDDYEIFEVSYVQQQGLRDKISNLLHDSAKALIKKWYKGFGLRFF